MDYFDVGHNGNGQIIAQSNTQNNESWTALMIAFKVTALILAAIHAWGRT